MKQNKVRNHSRIQRYITFWKEHYINFGPTYLNSKNLEYTHANIRVSPYNGFTQNNNVPAPMKGKTRQMFIEAFLEIFDAWETQAKMAGNDYYLKIWIYEPYFEKSEIVYAVRDRVEYYENLFRPHKKDLQFPVQNYGSLTKKISSLRWSPYLNEQHIFDTEKGEIEDFATLEDYTGNLKWFSQMMKKPHETTVYQQEDNTTITMYSFRKGIVWIGE